MRSFIIRPFGTKTTEQGLEVDFDRIAQNLIDPAMSAAGLTGRETIEIVSQGNIREDMFQRLLTADVVIADITIHNANVFYELGLRHALRGRVTFLLRGNTVADVVPFDLKTDRYLGYDPENPENSVGALTDALQASIRSERHDSPVFQLLPKMTSQDPEVFLIVPKDFREAVDLCLTEDRVPELALMSLEVERMSPDWEVPAHRLIGEALFQARAFGRSHSAWERVRRIRPDDHQANLRLGTIYQKQGHLGKSEIALKRIRSTDRDVCAQVESLRGSNAKQLWVNDWRGATGDEARRKALESPYLDGARAHYAAAFGSDLNHIYSGINTLMMIRIQTALAQAMPEVWANLYPSDEAAAKALAGLLDRAVEIGHALNLALQTTTDAWREVVRADMILLDTTRPGYAIRAYRAALRGMPDQAYDTVLRQLEVYTALGLFEPAAAKVEAALRDVSRNEELSPTPPRFMIFTGHRVDTNGRRKPRFPNTKKAIAQVRKDIESAIRAEMTRHPDEILTGVAGGANGGDLLFHEACDNLGIPSWLLLAIPREEYLIESVQDGGRDWVERFERIYETRRAAGRLLVLQQEGERPMPDWLADMPAYGVWERNNLWTLSFGFQFGHDRASLIAFWDGQRGDGMGGTEDMVALAQERGVPQTVLSNCALLGAGDAD